MINDELFELDVYVISLVVLSKLIVAVPFTEISSGNWYNIPLHVILIIDFTG